MPQEVWGRQNWQHPLHFWRKSRPGLPLKMTKEDGGGGVCDKMHPATSLSCQPPPTPNCGRENTDMRDSSQVWRADYWDCLPGYSGGYSIGVSICYLEYSAWTYAANHILHLWVGTHTHPRQALALLWGSRESSHRASGSLHTVRLFLGAHRGLQSSLKK